MATFIAFAGWDYYPEPGAHDAIAVFEEVSDRAAAVRASQLTTKHVAESHSRPDWWHVARLDTDALVIVGHGKIDYPGGDRAEVSVVLGDEP